MISGSGHLGFTNCIKDTNIKSINFQLDFISVEVSFPNGDMVNMYTGGDNLPVRKKA